MEIMKETPWSRTRGQNSVNKELLETVGNGKPTGSLLKETTAVSVTISISVQNWHSRIRLRVLSCSRKNASRTQSPRGKSPSSRMSRWPSKDYLKGTCTNSFCENGILQNACSTSPRVGADLGKSALMRIARLMNSQAKGPKRMVTKVQWLLWRSMSDAIERRDPLCRTHQIHDNWVPYSRIWSRRSLHRFYGRAKTYGNRSDV